MIRQDVLYLFSSTEASFIGLNCSMQTMACYSQNKMSAEVLLSPLETKVMQLFFQHFPVFVPDAQMAEALYPGQRNHLGVEAQVKKNVSRVLTQLRTRIKPLDLNIRRVNQTGYLLEESSWAESCCTTTKLVSMS
jgi:DNA-binding response OmpR family regulator